MCIFNVKTIVRYPHLIIKACRLLSVKNCHAKGRELTPRMYSQFNELIVGHKKFPQFARCFDDKIGQLSDNLLDLQLEGTVLDLSARTFWRKNFCGNKFSRAGFFLPRENFPLYGSMTFILQWWQNYILKKLQGFGTSTSPTFQLTLSFLGWVWALDYTTPTNMGMRVSYLYVHKSQSC